jgi:hypothetical protein
METPMNTMFTADTVDQIMNRIDNYQRVIKLIRLKSIEDGACSIPHKVMANFLDVTQADIHKWIGRLIEFGIIEQMGSSNTYKMIHTDMEYSSLDQVMDLLKLLKETPNLSFFLQAKTLGISIKELELLFGFLIEIME